ncbi:MAG: winged helix-turn-helix domain-containing protein, partial [Woeseiaceae bacterium]
ELLVYLAKRQGRVAKTEELLNDLWAGKIVTDGTVYNCVAELRHVLDDTQVGQTSIETIPKKGYRLLLPVTGLDNAQDQREARFDKAWSTKRLAISIATVLLLSIAGVVTWTTLSERDSGLEQIADDEFKRLAHSVAVLPFEDLSADKNNEYLADGIAEILIHQLSQLKDLQVIARQSSFTFKGKNTDVRKIGKALNVESVLEGSVQRADGKLRIAAQLIDTRSGTHIWSKLFDRDEAGIFNIQDEIAQAVASEISGSMSGEGLTPEWWQRFERRRTDNIEAYNAVLRGDQRHSLASIEGRIRADVYYRRALELDPAYAMAWQRLASLLVSQWENGNEPVELLLEARDAIDRSLELDDQDGRAWTTRAELELRLTENGEPRFTFEDIEGMFERALELSPNDGWIYARYALVLAWTTSDRLKVLEPLRKAVSLDPLSAGLHNRLADELRKMQEFDEAQQVLARSRELQPDHPYGYWHAGETYRDAGDLAEAIIWMQKALRFEANDASGPFYIALVALDLGAPELVEYWVGEVLRIDPEHELAEIARVIAYRARGNKKAMQNLADRHASSGPPYSIMIPTYREILRDRDIDNGQPEVALARYREQIPALFLEEVQFETIHPNDVIDLAYLLQLLGQDDSATYLLEPFLLYMTDLPENIGVDSRHKIRVAETLGLLGRIDDAARILEQVGTTDWPQGWTVVRWRRTLDPVRATAAFKDLVRRMEAHQVAQRERYAQMTTKGGEI